MSNANNALSKLRKIQKRYDGVTMPIRRKRIKWGRNWLCLCGSKKKYKLCCYDAIQQLTKEDDNADPEKLQEDLQKMIDDHRNKMGLGNKS